MGYIFFFQLVFLFSLGKYPEVELLDPMVVLLLIFWGTAILFSTMATPIYISPGVHKGPHFFTFLHISSPTFVVYYHFGNSHSDVWSDISLWFFFFLKPWLEFFLIHLFIYLWLRWVFVAAHGLSLVAESGGYSSLRASHCGGFSCCGAQALGAQASVVVARGLSSCGSWALERRLRSCGTRA